LIDCFRSGGKLLLCGNGGSAADCEHITAELMKGMERKRPVYIGSPLQGALPAISLVSQTSLITAIGNDIGWDYVYEQQVLGYGKPGDVLLAISTSGRSRNVLNAINRASEEGLRTIGLTGMDTGLFDSLCDVVISCPGNTAAEIQEGHIKVYHEICRRLEEEFFG
jgi:D-sedoheptulose 7-phosphate isomerase